MKKIDHKILIITCIICLLPIILGLIFYNELPQSIAVHFNIKNNPDGFMTKGFFVFGFPIIMCIIQSFICIFMDVKEQNPEANRKILFITKLIMPIVTVVMYVVTIIYSSGTLLDIRKIVMILLGIMFLVLGNYLPKTVDSTSMNIPKITDEKTNIKVKKIYGYMFIINGLLAIVSTLFTYVASIGVIALVFLESIALYVYALIKNKESKIKL